ncbi:Hypothetical predicted protein [Octopus vulgaris]|uniref:Uncharacterized protein n=1 Tax=Octopus vulgaris TaxID=6645 RepID=A0AA36AQF9_OCTVU|nr:Hypothetical predicted protein [Octopus vulgaris]
MQLLPEFATHHKDYDKMRNICKPIKILVIVVVVVVVGGGGGGGGGGEEYYDYYDDYSNTLSCKDIRNKQKITTLKDPNKRKTTVNNNCSNGNNSNNCININNVNRSSCNSFFASVVAHKEFFDIKQLKKKEDMGQVSSIAGRVANLVSSFGTRPKPLYKLGYETL